MVMDRTTWANPHRKNKAAGYRSIKDPGDEANNKSMTIIRKGSQADKDFKEVRDKIKKNYQAPWISEKQNRRTSRQVGAKSATYRAMKRARGR